MFNQDNNEEKKLDWMYKGPNSTVDREEYLLGRPVDKTLEQINEDDKQKQHGLVATPKNRVEHECIPPSIRDFNKLVQAEQVDLSTKLQEDPLVAIKKREEETRRQFLQNPVQLKKLQKALKAQQAKKKKKKAKHPSDSDSDLEAKLTEKLLGKKNKKISKEERDLDTILIHKYEALKDKLTESDLQDILNGKITDSDDSIEEKDTQKKKWKKKKRESSVESDENRRKTSHYKKDVRDQKPGDRRREVDKYQSQNRRGENYYRNMSQREHKKVMDRSPRRRSRSKSPPRRSRSKSPRRRSRSPRHRSSSSENYDTGKIKSSTKNYDSDGSDSPKNKRMNYGLVTSDGKKIPLIKRDDRDRKKSPKAVEKAPEPPPPVQKNRAKKMTDEEKEKLRQEMMDNAVRRDKERERNVRKYREKEDKERKEQNFDPEFIHKQLLKSANVSSVESRIKANVNNIQRSGRDMDKHFSRR